MPQQLRKTGISISYGIGAMHAIRLQKLPKNLKHPARLLLLVLASHASNKDGSCFPSQRTLSAECGMGMTAVQSNLNILRDFGLIEIQNRSVENAQGKQVKMTNVYRLKGFQKFVGEKFVGDKPTSEKDSHIEILFGVNNCSN